MSEAKRLRERVMSKVADGDDLFAYELADALDLIHDLTKKVEDLEAKIQNLTHE